MLGALLKAFRIKIFFTVLLGLIYPVLIWGVATVLAPNLSSGDLVQRNGKVIGARELGQKFTAGVYFWGRPSAVDYNPLSSGGSNLGPTSAALKKAVDERIAVVQNAHGIDLPIPQDLLFASASGLDPDISPAAAMFQVDRVVRARGLPAATASKLRQLIVEKTEPAQLGLFGEARVNVLALNLALDEMTSVPNLPPPAPTPGG